MIAAALMLGCAESPEPAEEIDTTAEAPAAEETHDLRGVVVERDPMANTLKVAHEAIGDWMGAMTMSFPVRGEDVQNLPENGEQITATVHVDGTEYWLTDVEVVEAEEAPGAAEQEDVEEDAAE